LIDITDRVTTVERERKPGRWMPDQLVFNGEVIGHLECAGAVISAPGFCSIFRPNREGRIERRIFRLEPHELPA
jgi:hypothetical protein